MKMLIWLSRNQNIEWSWKSSRHCWKVVFLVFDRSVKERAAIGRIVVRINFQQFGACWLRSVVVDHLLIDIEVLCNGTVEELSRGNFVLSWIFLDVVVLVERGWNFRINCLDLLFLRADLLLKFVHYPMMWEYSMNFLPLTVFVRKILLLMIHLRYHEAVETPSRHEHKL